MKELDESPDSTKYDILNEKFKELCSVLTPTEERMYKIYDTLVAFDFLILDTPLKEKYSDMESMMFGSAVNGLMSNYDSDLDIILIIPDFEEDQRVLLRQIEK